MARKKKPEEHISHERWLVSYADFITLLFAFFTTMYAISNVDAQKMGKMVVSMRASFDAGMFSPGSNHLTLSSGTGKSPDAVRDDLVGRINPSKGSFPRDEELNRLEDLRNRSSSGGQDLGRLKRNMDSLLSAEVLRGQVETHMEGRGLIISLGEGGFFDSGSDQIKPAGLELLDTIVTALVSGDNHIRVEGHTDNVPIRNTRFPSNWELSTARATAIIVYMIGKFGFQPDLLSAAGYGEYRPVATNETIEGRARNRRIDIVVLNPASVLVEPR